MARVGDGAAPASVEAVRVTFLGVAGGMASSMVVDLHADGALDVDGVLDEVRVVDAALPRVRLAEPGGTHAALVTTLPDPSRASAGVDRVEVVVDGWRFEVDVESEPRARLRERATSARGSASRGGPLELRAIIPGRVVSVDVAIGDAVDAGGRLLVIEAMKMQNELRSPRGGTVGRLAVGAGQTVERGDLLLVLE